MCGAILSVPEIASSPTATRIAVAPLRNSSRYLIDKDIFIARLRLELSRFSQGRVQFLSQDLGQDVRSQIIGSQDEEMWDKIITECANALVGSKIVEQAKEPVRVAVIPVRKTNLAGMNADSFTALVRAKISEKAGGKIQFLARNPSGKVIEQILAEDDLKNVGLVISSATEKIAGVDYFLGGEFVAESLKTESLQQERNVSVGSDPNDPRKVGIESRTDPRSPNVTKYLNLMLINATTGVVPFEKLVRVERKMQTGLSQAKLLLTGDLRSLSKAAAGGDRSDYVMVSFQLVNPETNVILWEDAYETKKVTTTSVIYK